MTADEVKRYQYELRKQLEATLAGCEAVMEWSASLRRIDSYSPRLDVALGPFAFETRRFEDDYDSLLVSHSSLVGDLWRAHVENVGRGNLLGQRREGLRDANRNARCFMAIEIENSGTRKHLMGGALNAAALGRIAIIVAWKPKLLRALIRLRRYFAFLGASSKPTLETSNLLVLKPEQLIDAVSIRRAV